MENNEFLTVAYRQQQVQEFLAIESWEDAEAFLRSAPEIGDTLYTTLLRFAIHMLDSDQIDVVKHFAKRTQLASQITGSSGLRAIALLISGGAAIRVDNPIEANAKLLEAEDIFRELNDFTGIITTLINRAALEQQTNHFLKARMLYDETIDLLTKIKNNDLHLWRLTLTRYRELAQELRRTQNVETLDQEVIALLAITSSEELQDYLGDIERNDGKPQLNSGGGYHGSAFVENLLIKTEHLRKVGSVEASKLAEHALEAARRLGSAQHQGLALLQLGFIDQEEGQYILAASRFKEAEGLYRESGNRLGLAHALKSRGDLARLMNAQQEAIRLYNDAEEIYQELGNQIGLTLVHKSRGELL